MFGLFGSRLPIDEDELEWQLATFKWLQREFGDLAGRALVLPTRSFFPPSAREGHGRVEDLFGHVRRAAGMEDWDCELRPGAADRHVQVGTDLTRAAKALARRFPDLRTSVEAVDLSDFA